MNARTQVFDLSMEGRQVDEVLSSIFHTVLFHRSVGKFMYGGGGTTYSVGTVGHMDVDCDFIDFTYVSISSPSLDSTIRREITNFSEKLRNNDSTGSGSISLEFFQRKHRTFPFHFMENCPWEVWTVRLDLLNMTNEDERQVCREQVSEMLADKIMYITDVMNRPNYVPKIPTQAELPHIFDTSYTDIQPYLFTVKFDTAKSGETSVSRTMKKLIKETLSLWLNCADAQCGAAVSAAVLVSISFAFTINIFQVRQFNRKDNIFII